jgi:hypothetical protein
LKFFLYDDITVFLCFLLKVCDIMHGCSVGGFIDFIIYNTLSGSGRFAAR